MCLLCSCQHAGAWDQPGHPGLHTGRPEEEEHFARGGHCYSGCPPSASGPLPHHNEPTGYGPRPHQTGGQTAVLHHLCRNTQPPAAAEGHVFVEQRAADQVGSCCWRGLKFFHSADYFERWVCRSHLVSEGRTATPAVHTKTHAHKGMWRKCKLKQRQREIKLSVATECQVRSNQWLAFEECWKSCQRFF